MCEGGDACVKKTAGLRGDVCEPFSSAGAPASIARVPIPKALFASFSGIRERREWICVLEIRHSDAMTASHGITWLLDQTAILKFLNRLFPLYWIEIPVPDQ
jgi:hypothetical protein